MDRYFQRKMSLEIPIPVIDEKICKGNDGGCGGFYVSECTQEAITKIKFPKINLRLCIACGECIRSCPNDAISFSS